MTRASIQLAHDGSRHSASEVLMRTVWFSYETQGTGFLAQVRASYKQTLSQRTEFNNVGLAQQRKETLMPRVRQRWGEAFLLIGHLKARQSHPWKLSQGSYYSSTCSTCQSDLEGQGLP